MCNHNNSKKIVYICHPFRGDITGNQLKVKHICEAIKNECVPLAPHLLLPHYLNEKTERKLALGHGLVLLRASDEVWIVSERISDGMKSEIEEARRLRIPVRDKTNLLPSAKAKRR